MINQKLLKDGYYSGNTTYSTGSDSTPSCRLDATGEYVEIYFADIPDSVSYYIKGTGTNQTAENGTVFTVKESIDRQNWTTIHTFNKQFR